MPSSPVEYLLFEKYEQCLTADALNEIESTIHDVRAPRIYSSSTQRLLF